MKGRGKKTPKFDSSFVPRISEGTIWRENPGGTVAILSLNNDEVFFTLDAVAAEIWLLIDGKRKLADIKSMIGRKYNIPENYFDGNIAKLLTELCKEHLLSESR